MNKQVLFLCFLSLLQSSTLFAQDDLTFAFNEELTSIATGHNQSILTAPSVVSIITSNDIERIGATTLEEVLQTVPGINVSVSDYRFASILSIRGIYTSFNPHVLVLVNGMPMTSSPYGRATELSYPSVNSIHRIEIIRGPGSAVYGADAFAGVINIITKTSNNIDGTEGGARIGSFGKKEAWAQHGGKWDNLNFMFGVNYFTTDGDKDRIIYSDAQTLFDDAFGTNASLAPGQVKDEIKRYDIRYEVEYKNWKFRGWHTNTESNTGPGLAQALDPSAHVNLDTDRLELLYQNDNLFKDWDLTSTFSVARQKFRTKQRLFPAGSILPIGSDGNVNPVTPSGLVLFSEGMIGNPNGDENRYRINLTGTYRGVDKHRIRLALGGYRSEPNPKETKNFGPTVIIGDELLPPPELNIVDGTLTDVGNTPWAFLSDTARTNFHFSFQDEWFFASDWNLTSGVRYDHYSDFGGTVNPRIALVWETRPDLTTKLMYGKAFRAPSDFELYGANNPVVVGNNDLDPEIINTIELSFNYRPTFSFKTNANLFAYKIKDLIEYVSNPATLESIAANFGERTGYGTELETEWKTTEDLTLRGNYSFVMSEDTDTNSNSGYSPKHQIYLSGDWDLITDWSLHTELNWIIHREREFGDPRNEIDDYKVVNLSLRRKNIAKNLSAALLVRNIFDENVYDPSPYNSNVPSGSFIPGDYPMDGRSIMGEIRFRF